MIIVATQIRVGMILNLEGELYRVNWTQHVTPGKGVACMQTKLKHIMNGKNLEQRFRSADKVEKAELETHDMQYLYEDSDGLVFMDNSTFEQVTISKDLIGDGFSFMTEGVSYLVTFFESTPVGIELPKTLDFKVTVAPPEVRKATASASLRPIEIENGMTIQAPTFIKEGDIVRVNTETGEYLERVR
ncbi:MAG: elongation factor P [Candidatus Margulisiibacteriota bacterium]